MPPTNTRSFATSVLLIDGNETDRHSYAEQLKHSPDYLIAEAADGQSGLDYYRARKPDCIVLDFDLPDRSGFEVFCV